MGIFRIVLAITISLLVLTTVSCSGPTEKQDKANIIMILADDLGYSDLGCYGSEIPTPNLDKLAEEDFFSPRCIHAGDAGLPGPP